MRSLFIFMLVMFHSLAMAIVSEGLEEPGVVVLPVYIPAEVIVTALPSLAVSSEFKAVSRAVVARYKTLSIKDATEVMQLAFLHAKKQKVDPYLVVAIIAAESSFRQKAVSKAGAKGFMQVMDKVHKVKVKGRNPLDASVNLEVGVSILSDCFKRFTSNRGALGCYNGATTKQGIDKYYLKITQKQIAIRSLTTFLES